MLSDLTSLLTKDKVEVKKKTDAYGNDGEIVVYPTTEMEISEIVTYAHNNDKKINIVGAGTKRGYGGIKESADILLSLKNYSGIIEHTAGDLTLTVKAGTQFKEIQDHLLTYDQMISLDPSWSDDATIGGIIAANESGPKRLRYGSVRDLVIGLRVVYPDGKVIRSGGKVVKNVAGYDMNKLFVGSMGTLGIITEITIKLRPIPKYESLILLSFHNYDQDHIRNFVSRLMDSMMEPTAVELINPTLSEELTGKSTYTLAIGFEDVKKSVHYQEEYIKNKIPDGIELTILHEQSAKNFWRKITSHFQHAQAAQEEREIILKVGVKNLDVIHVIKESQLLEETNNLVIQSHGGLGHGLCLVSLKGASDDILPAIDSIREVVEKLGGYVIVKHSPLALRQEIDVWGKKPSYFFLFEGIKLTTDPKRTLNDKRFIGGL